MIVTVKRTASIGHRLPSYKGICSSPHGHNIVVVVDVDVTGFLDFKVLDALLWQVLQPMDHAMILQKEDPLLIVLEDMGFRTYSTNEEPTTEYLAEVIGSELVHHHLLSVTKVTVHETDKYSATWRNPNAFPRR